MRRRTSLGVEHLETRDTPATFGTPWPDGRNLTMSFAPQGTAIGENSSDLASLDPTARMQILAAFQSWVANANLNIGLVADNGARFGTAGVVQGDTRFGDIRVGGVPLAADVLAITAPFNNYDAFSGNVVVNTDALGAGGPDLFTVMLQEAGHALSLGNSSNTASVMYEYYRGVRAGLAPEDLGAIQALYGVRTPDVLEGAGGNETPANASRYLGTLRADLTSSGDVDVYRVTAGLLATSLAVNLRAQGLSLLTSRVEILDSSGHVLKSLSTQDPTSNDLSLSLGNVHGGATYFVRVSGSRSDAFGVGSYELDIQQRSLLGNLLGAVSKQLDDTGLNDTLDSATGLIANTSTVSAGTEFGVDGRFDSSSDKDVYRMVVPPSSASSVNLVTSVWQTDGGSLTPWIEVFDAAGNKLAFDVLNADGASTVLQVQGVVPGSAYFLSVSSDARAVGTYHLSADLREDVQSFEHGGAGTLTSTSQFESATLNLVQTAQVHFVLTADGAAGDVAEFIVRTAGGNEAARFTTNMGRGRSIDVYLAAGTYVIEVRAKTLTSLLHFKLGLAIITDPAGATPTDPTSAPDQPPPPPMSPPPTTTPSDPPPPEEDPDDPWWY